jgi:uncharacterized protein with ParB-like and HNH nuclease domain
MKKILGDAKSVRSLLSQKYRIDYYQRDYKWEKKQIRELVEDLTTRFFQDFEVGHPRDAVARYGQYFLGSIIVSEKDGERFIVDGQQRLTSLTLLLTFLDGLQRARAPDDRVEIANLVYSTQYGKKSFNLDVPERTTCLQSIINGEKPDSTDQPPSVQNLIARYNEIAEIFPEELRDTALPYFLDWLSENVMLVEITAFSDDDAYTIFETMNDRGLSLTPTDMLKGYILANITDDMARAQAGDAWKAQMVKLRDLGKDEDADCIKAWLRSQYAEKIRERKARATPEDFDKQGTEFHRWIRENRDRVGLINGSDFTSFVTNDFRFYARAYIIARRAADIYAPDFGSVYFNAQNSFTLQFPMMLAPLRTEDDDVTLRRKMRLVATFIEILLARRMWNFKAIDHSTMQYRAFLIMKGIRGMDIESLREDLVSRLSEEGTDRDDYIDFHTQEAFRLHGTNGPQVHRLLARLTEFVEVSSGGAPRYPEYSNRSSKKGGYQIEHLWADHADQHTDEFSHPADFAAYRNRVGGLVLLPAGDNASYSDMAYPAKVAHYAKQNLLACSLHPLAYENKPGFRNFRDNTGLNFTPKQTLTRADLDERQSLYIDLANLCWSPERLLTI